MKRSRIATVVSMFPARCRGMRVVAVGVIFLACGLPSFAQKAEEQAAQILLKTSEVGQQYFVIVNLSSAVAEQISAEHFSVYVLPLSADANTPMMGKVQTDGGEVKFLPRFPLQGGREYRAVLQYPGVSKSDRLEADFAIPATDRPRSRVVEIFPQEDSLPQNLLKMYFYFSQPMSRGEVYQYIHLLDESGKRIERPFLELPQELWDEEGKRFTLLFDPGRIKRGLVPNEEMGPPLLPDQTYSLVIDAGWPDAAGAPLLEGFRKTFSVTSPDHQQPRVDRWVIRPPRKDSQESLEIRFDEPLDRGMLDHAIQVLDESGNRVNGELIIGERDDSAAGEGFEAAGAATQFWRFAARQKWVAGTYVLEIDSRLEDRAGNSLAQPFEVDLTRPPGPVHAKEYLHFTVR